MRRFALLLPLLLGQLLPVQAQEAVAPREQQRATPWKEQVPDGWPSWKRVADGMRHTFYSAFGDAFTHLDFSVTTGTTGIGFDVQTPLNQYLSVRAGYAVMPHLTHTMHFGVEVGDDPATSQSKFERLSGMLADFTGNRVDDVVDMEGQPTYWNWKLLVDVKPFRNKGWHFTTGIFAGNRQVARAVNAIEDMPSLMAVNIYNNLYSRAYTNTLEFDYGGFTPNLEQLGQKLLDYGRMSIHMGNYKHDVYYKEDEVVENDVIIDEVWYPAGYVMHAAGDLQYAKGDPYRIVPDENSMVKAWAYAKRFKPYVGFGYGGRLLKSDDRWQVSFDCGALFWGGTPRIITHDGTDLVNDVENVSGKVGDYVDIIKKFKVFPVIDLRITRRLF